MLLVCEERFGSVEILFEAGLFEASRHEGRVTAGGCRDEGLGGAFGDDSLGCRPGIENGGDGDLRVVTAGALHFADEEIEVAIGIPIGDGNDTLELRCLEGDSFKGEHRAEEFGTFIAFEIEDRNLLRSSAKDVGVEEIWASGHEAPEDF